MSTEPIRLLAQAPIPLGRIGGAGLGPFANISGELEALKAITNIVSSIIGFFTIIAGIWFLLHIIMAGFLWIGSEGDKAKLQEAQSRITNAFVGLIVVVASWIILALARQFFGFDALISDPANLLRQLRFQQDSGKVGIPTGFPTPGNQF